MRAIALTFLLLAGCSQISGFDAQRWRTADLTTRERAGMVDSLVRKHPLKALDRNEVIALLGQPTATDKWRDSELVYVLGPEPGLIAIDHQWLLIELDGRGRVESFRVVTD